MALLNNADAIYFGGRSVDRVYAGPERAWPAWTPADLFANGEQGAWYDPSDLSSLFQDADGTVPVTAPEQPVGLMLDKRFGLAREDITLDEWTNHSFEEFSADGQSLTVNKTVSGGNRFALIGTPFTGTLGDSYEFEVVFTSTVGGSISFGAAANGRSNMIGIPPGTSSMRGVLTINNVSTNTTLRWQQATNGVTAIDSVVLRKLPGNHASQPTTTARPVLSARKNWVMRDSDAPFSLGSGWSGSSGATVAASSMFTPSGVRAAKLLASDVANQQSVSASTASALPAGSSCSVSVTAKAGELPCMGVTSWDGKTYFVSTLFDLINGVVKSGTGRMVDLGGGWWRCIVENRQRAVDSTTIPQFQVRPARSSDTVATTSGPFTPGEGIYFAEMDVEFSPTATRYQRVTTATDYDSAGFPHYLRFDGVDDELLGTGLTIPYAQADGFTLMCGVSVPETAAAYSPRILAVQNGTHQYIEARVRGDHFARLIGIMRKDSVLTPLGPQAQTGNYAYTPSQPFAYSLWCAADALTVKANTATNTVNYAGDPSTTYNTIGLGGPSIADGIIAMQVRGALVINRVLTDDERGLGRDWLMGGIA